MIGTLKIFRARTRMRTIAYRFFYPSLCVIPLFLSACSLKSADNGFGKELDRVMSEHHPEINSCYVAHQTKFKTIPSGLLRIHFWLSNAGHSYAFEADNSDFAEDSFMYQCVVSKVSQWKIIPPYKHYEVWMQWAL